MPRILPVMLMVGCFAVAGAGAERPSLDRVLIAADDIGGGWDTVGEAPTDPSQDPDLVRWGVREQRALHYTRERNGVVQVCSVEIWAFEDVPRARAAHANFTYPDWSITRDGPLVLMVRGITRVRGEVPRRGVFHDCRHIADRVRARAASFTRDVAP